MFYHIALYLSVCRIDIYFLKSKSYIKIKKNLNNMAGWLRLDAKYSKSLSLPSSAKQGEKIQQKACGLR